MRFNDSLDQNNNKQLERIAKNAILHAVLNEHSESATSTVFQSTIQGGEARRQNSRTGNESIQLHTRVDGACYGSDICAMHFRRKEMELERYIFFGK